MFHRFQYEAEFYPVLSRIPLDVRMKLDLTGVKLSLKGWLAFALAERVVLCHLPCESAEEKEVFTAYVDFLSRERSGVPVTLTTAVDSALWHQSKVPEAVSEKSAAQCRLAVTQEEWSGWKFHQRYALYKTAISESQPEAFASVLEQLRAMESSVPRS